MKSNMCGRTACTLAPDVICHSCSYYDGDKKAYSKPAWKEHPVSDKHSNSTSPHHYYPSANIAPTRYTPILFHDSASGERVVQPMMWGMIPSWHKGDSKNHKLSTNNCRLEGLMESKLYKKSLSERKFCVVLAQGFYEWKTVGADPKSTKQPYFIYMPQDDKYGDELGMKISDDSVWNSACAEWSEDKGWTGPKILMMAGLYDVWKSPEGENVYNYTVITMESNETLSWLHCRMPAILETPEEVQNWLHPEPNKSSAEIITMLKQASQLKSYTVSTKVNSSRCHDLDCAKPFVVKESKSKTFMDNWLKRSVPKNSESQPKPAKDNDESQEKKPKLNH